MAEVKITGLDKVRSKVRAKINSFIEDSGVLEDVANYVVTDIKTGRNPKTGRNFKALKNSTIQHRKYIAKNNPTDPAYAPAKSNLTITGGFLNSIKAFIKRREHIISIRPTGTHKKYRGANGRPIGKTVKNEDLAKYHAEMGRSILEFSKKNATKIVEIIKERARKYFAR